MHNSPFTISQCSRYSLFALLLEMRSQKKVKRPKVIRKIICRRNSFSFRFLRKRQHISHYVLFSLNAILDRYLCNPRAQSFSFSREHNLKAITILALRSAGFFSFLSLSDSFIINSEEIPRNVLKFNNLSELLVCNKQPTASDRWCNLCIPRQRPKSSAHSSVILRCLLDRSVLSICSLQNALYMLF